MIRSIAVALLICLIGAPAFAQSFPSGIIHDTPVTGISGGVGLAFVNPGSGDERLFIIEQVSRRLLVADLAGNRQTVGTIAGVNTSGNERGLLGVAVDPNWPARPFVYFHITSTSGDVRIIRHTINGDVSNPASLNLTLGSRYEVVTGMPDARFNHNGGTVRFGPDGMLYASLGDDAANSCNAQTIGDGRGIIFRMDVSGLPAGAGGPPSIASLRPATGNPPFASGTYAPITYAYGLRNPYRFNIDSVTGNLYIADVGQNAWEEMDELSNPGENFGWPIFEGNASFSGSCPLNGTAKAPMVAVSHSQGWASIVSFGGRYRNVPGGSRNLGPQYEGQVFYTDFFSGQVRRLEQSGANWVNPAPVSGQTNATNWGTGLGGCSDAVIGPDGAIYYTDLTGGVVGRVSGDPSAALMTVLNGDDEPANAGQPMAAPFRVRVATLGGTPIQGRTITWSATGSITLNGTTSVTDANGEATMMATMNTTFTGVPSVTASASVGSNVSFNPIWRGLSVNVVQSFVVVTIRHSEPLSPVILVADVPVGSPYLTTPFGDIWTSIFSLTPTFFAFDGFGVFAPLDPAYVTTTSSTLTRLFTISPSTGGAQIMLQAYANDSTRIGQPTFVMITNEVLVTLP